MFKKIDITVSISLELSNNLHKKQQNQILLNSEGLLTQLSCHLGRDLINQFLIKFHGHRNHRLRAISTDFPHLSSSLNFAPIHTVMTKR